MVENLGLRPQSRKMPLFRKIPWALSLIIYMVIVHFADWELEGGSIASYIFIGLCLFVLFMEFFKSANINTTSFLVDTVSAVFSVIVATVLMTYLFMAPDQQNPSFFHWLGVVIILGDAILSPYNSFRTALRNFGLGVDG